MRDFRNPSGITRAAVIAVSIYLAVQSLYGLVSLWLLLSPPVYGDEPAMLFSAGLALAVFVSMISCVILVGRWTYRVNSNAHVLSDELTITPGWAVGWHFVPIANLFKPFQAMKEAWMASHYRSGWQGEPAPALLGWWWALWIVTNMLANLSFRLQMNAEETLPSAVFAVEVVVAALNIALCLLLIRMMRELCRAQITASHDHTFA